MFITPRSYLDSQTPDHSFSKPSLLRFHSITGWQPDSAQKRRAINMLLLHQAGSVRVGEVISGFENRYTLTYTPSADPYPIPTELHVKVKNTSAIPLRAAYLHGPYTLYTSCYPSGFDPNTHVDGKDKEEIPQFEPYLKAGGSWKAVIPIPKHLHRKLPVDSDNQQSVTWVIEIISQVIFSTTAVVNYELLVSRDDGSPAQSLTGGASVGKHRQAAQLRDHMEPGIRGKQMLARKGVFSQAISLNIDDTTSLWNTPPFPSEHDPHGGKRPQDSRQQVANAGSTQVAENLASTQRNSRRKKVHLVVLTHGLHSNLGADMLFLKESIDAAARKPKTSQKRSSCKTGHHVEGHNSASLTSPVGEDDQFDNHDPDDELVIVRGFSGNAVRTERGIQYLGKRLAKYVLFMTYPDQPYMPRKKTRSGAWSGSFNTWKSGRETEENATCNQHIYTDEEPGDHRSYRITSISFIGHSLGGLIQTYAIAYIHKHSPTFFDLIRPINFIALASPFLGLSNENPMYVRFALDLGLVGRTGQDLGLSWTAPRVRSGWEAMIGGKGMSAKSRERPEDGPKPLLRVLPCGPAHEALSKFDRRTVYSNVVNDGIVPLRTSCLLFLDWRGLERVEKARRKNGLVGTMAEWGWAELTGANSILPQPTRSPYDNGTLIFRENNDESNTVTPLSEESRKQANTANGSSIAGSLDSVTGSLSNREHRLHVGDSTERHGTKEPSIQAPTSPLSSLFSIFRAKEVTNKSDSSFGYKHTKIYKRSQTLSTSSELDQASVAAPLLHQESLSQSSAYEGYMPHTPPRTTFFESAGDLLMPPIPPIEFILDPDSRPRAIFHDRVYHPEDIPPPLPTKRKTAPLSAFERKVMGAQGDPTGLQKSLATDITETSGLRVEEKIARSYHREMSWRKVLVRLEPDAHNNIIVRRMFTNAYGWPVIKHLVDSHFGQDALAQGQSSLGRGTQRADSSMIPACDTGNKHQSQTDFLHQEVHSSTLSTVPIGLPMTSIHTHTQSEICENMASSNITGSECHRVLNTD
ncbi:lipase ROG1 family protein [Aspergillus clavatus NRRL 1]|uniref:Lipase/serine esterase, putative n=1 Tax=Aspergillus clavatus (strain ATCC 1007 / CBS 513.65 / DSM 816 / NCTC 3887 / NRRL 1 / QM 1276 / 107) TaxID=344612 RepID=A1CC42_ASPCL|nr:lipase/serine esterase, putative [Aspergillus clavatus NRRL 1]EAW12099.1 lipase/serine esterase, putative [Aspergillus clavatus NRRL 1]